MIEYSSTGDPPIEDSSIQDSSIEDSTSDNNLGVPSDNDLSYNDLSDNDLSDNDLSNTVVPTQDLGQGQDLGLSVVPSEDLGLSVVPSQELGLIQILGTLTSIDELPTTEVVAGSAYIIDETIWIYSNTGWIDMLSTELIPSELDVTSSGDDDEIQLLSLNEILALPDTLDDSLSFWSDPLVITQDAPVADALKASPDAALYIAPVRNVTTIASEMKPMSYRTNTSELIYDSTAVVLPGPGGPQGRTGTTTGPTGFRGATGTAGASLLGPSGPIGISLQGSSFGDYLYWGTSNWLVGSQNIILGRKAIFTNQGTNAIAIGENAGQVSQNVRSIAIGQGAGQTNQLANAISIGQGAGQTNQQTNAIAIGQFAGQSGQGVNAIAVGQSAGQTNQWSGAIAVGAYAGLINQGTNAIAVANGNGLPLTPYIALNPNSWTPVANSQTTLFSFGSSVKSVAYGQNSAGNRLWVAGAYSAVVGTNGVLASSTNGTNWTAISGSKTLLFGGDAQVNAVAYGQDGAGNRLWIAGAQSPGGGGGTAILAYSYYGQTGWTAISGSKTALFGGDARVHAVAYGQDSTGNRLWVAGGSGTTNVLAYSSNGTNWFPVANSQTILFGGNSTVYSVAYGQDGAGNRLWVAGAYGDTNTLAYSSNGMTGWTTVENSKTALFGQNAYVQSVAFGQDGAGNRLWVAGAQGATAVLAYSYNGTTWTAIANSQTTLFGGFSILYSVAYGQDVSGNRLWLAGANGGIATLAYSNDGINWNVIPNTKDGLFGGAAAAYSLAYGQDTNGSPFWVAGGDGTTATLAYMNNQTLLPNTNANQSQNAISIGQNAGFNTQQTNAIAIGLNAGQTNQGALAIAIGINAGAFTQQTSAIAIGFGAGQNAQGVSAIAFGQVAGQVNQAANAIAIGIEAGQMNQSDSAIAIGADAGQFLQGTNAIAIGQAAGQTNQGTNAIAMGQLAGGFGQGANAIAIGQGAGQTNQQTNAIAIGQSAGQTNQGTNAVAMGQLAGAFGQGVNAIAIGQGAGQTNQQTNAIAIGQSAGQTNQATSAIAIGQGAGASGQGVNAIAIGRGAGQNSQQSGAIAIGVFAGQTNQRAGAISIANAGFYLSLNPESWTGISGSKTTLFGGDGYVKSVAYGLDSQGNNLWMAGGIGGTTNTLAYSSDGISWTSVPDSKTNLFGGNSSVYSVAYGKDGAGNNLWVAGAFGATSCLAYSSDGRTGWTPVADSLTALWGWINGTASLVYSVAYGKDGAGVGLWLAGAQGSTNTLAYSYNGMTGWTPVANSKTGLWGAGGWAQSVAYGLDSLGNGLWVAGGAGPTNVLVYSSNGITGWTGGISKTVWGPGVINSVAYGKDSSGNALWIAGGSAITGMSYSSNGMTGWTSVPNSNTNLFGGDVYALVSSVAYGLDGLGNGLWVVGANGTTNTLAYSSFGLTGWSAVQNSKTNLWGGSSSVSSLAYGQDGGGNRFWLAGASGATNILGYMSNFTIMQGVSANQGTYSIAIGQNSGAYSQNQNSLAIGTNSGQTNQGPGSVAVGQSAGAVNQGQSTVAVGVFAGAFNQKEAAVAIGSFAGQTNQGTYAITIGNANMYGLDPVITMNPQSWTPVANSQTTLLGGSSTVFSVAYGQDGAGNRLWVVGGGGNTNIFAYSSNGTNWTAVANSQTTIFGGSANVQSVAFGQDGAGNRLWVAGCLFSATSILAYSSNGMTGWTAVSDSKTTIFGGNASLYSVAYGQDGAGNRLWVAGASGYAGASVNSILAYSSNGTSWTGVVNSQTTLFGGNSQVFAVAYGQDGAGNRLWVAGSNGTTATLAYSSNGTSWTPISGSITLFGGSQVQVYALAYGQDGAGNRLWVAGGTGTDNALAYSSNGTNWTPISGSKTTLFGGDARVRTVAFGQDGAGNRLWVAGAQAAGAGGGTAILAYSSNGMTGWTAVANSQTILFGGDGIVYSVAYGQDPSGNPLWVAGSNGATAVLAYSGQIVTIPLDFKGASVNQGISAIAIGQNAGAYTQGQYSVAIGQRAGQTNQGVSAVAVGQNAGALRQSGNAIAIGQGAGQFNQNINALAIGINAGQTNQADSSIAIGLGAGQTNQLIGGIAIGSLSGAFRQSGYAVAIGQGAGQTNQSTLAIAIGQGAGQTNQRTNAIAIGQGAGAFGQGSQSVAIGQLAGAFGQGVNSIAIGQSAGQTNQGTNAIAIGLTAGQTNQGTNAIAIGLLAGAFSQGHSAIALGFGAGQTGQQTNAIAIANSGSVQIITPTTTWTPVTNSQTTIFGGLSQVNSIAYGQDGDGRRLWVAGSDLGNNALLAYSYNAGLSWTAISGSKTALFGGDPRVKTVAYGQDNAGNRMWIAGAFTLALTATANIVYSYNGLSWSPVVNSKSIFGGDSNVYSIVYGKDGAGNGLWVATARGDTATLAYSYNGTNWTAVPNSQTTIFGGSSIVYSVAYGQDGAGNGLWVAGGNGTTNVLAYSSNGQTGWTPILNSQTTLFGGNSIVYSVAYGKDGAGNRLWVAGAYGTTAVLAYSSNGTGWTAVPNSQTTIFGGSSNVQSVAYGEDIFGNRLWVAGAYGIGGSGTTAVLAYSSNGITGWTSVVNSKTTLFGGEGVVYSVSYSQDLLGNPLWLAGGFGATSLIAYSINNAQLLGSFNQGQNAIAICQGAGQINQSANAVAIGQSAGQISQGSAAVAVGRQSGQSLQGTNAVAIGLNAGALVQTDNAVAIGQGAGQASQGANAIAIGFGAGQTNQFANAVAIGFLAGASRQTINAVAIGQQSGQTNQGTNAVAIGFAAGQTNQLTNAVAIGFLAGASGQGFSAVAIGQQSGQTNQGTNAIAIGLGAGQTNQVTNAIAIGFQAGQIGQNLGAIAIGVGAGFTNQGTNSIAIGTNAGMTNLGQFSVSIGAGSNVVDSYAIALGFNAGGTQSSGSRSFSLGTNSNGGIGFGAQAGSIRGLTNGIGIGGFFGIGGGFGIGAGSGMGNTFSVAIGYNNGFTNGANAAAIGFQAGKIQQQSGAIAIGFQAGQTNQGTNALAIGFKAGQVAQGSGAIAIGYQSGQFSQGQFAFAIGNQVGQISQGAYAVAIGNKAGVFQQGTNAVTIASSDGINEPNSVGFWAAVPNSQTTLFGGQATNVLSLAYGQDGSGNKLWVAGGASPNIGGFSILAYSSNGLNWTSVSGSRDILFGVNSRVYSVAYGQDGSGNRLWVAGAQADTSVLAYSSNGTSWTAVPNSKTTLFGGAAQVYSVAYGQDGAGNRLWVAGSSGTTATLAYSSNGITGWTPVSGSKTTLFGGNPELWSVAYGQDGAGNGLWVAGGYGASAVLAYSSNGMTGWTAVANSQTTLFGGQSRVNSLAYGQDGAGNRLWVAGAETPGAGGGTAILAYSYSGITGWTTVPNSKTGLFGGDAGVNSVAFGQDSFGNRLWVAGASAAGAGGGTAALAYSTNGITGWTTVPNSKTLLFGGDAGVNSVAFGQDPTGNQFWVAGSSSGATAILANSYFPSGLPMSSAFGQGQSAISIGYHAGQVTQGTAAVAIGFQAGQTNQGQNAVAIGSQAGQVGQGTSAVAIGFQAGFTNQGTGAIAIGYQMGQTNQPANSIDIGFQSGFTNQWSAAIAIGFNAGFSGQGTASVAIGTNAGFTNQGPNAVAVGVQAGQFNQGTDAVAVGFQVGQTNQGQGAVALGYSDIASVNQLYNSSSTGGFNQGFNAVAVGLYAGNYFQRSGAVALGYQAGQTNQGTNAVAIGFQSGLVNQGTNAIAIGYQIGQTNQVANTINIGFDVGEVGQGTAAIAIGVQAGQVSQGAGAIAIGFNAGQTNQATNAIALGFEAGSINQGVSAIALGAFAGQTNQQTNAIAIGLGAGAFNQQLNAIALGVYTGQTNQGTNAIMIGTSFSYNTGLVNQDSWSAVPNSQTTLLGNPSYVQSIAYGQDGAGNRLWVAAAYGTTSILAYSSNGTSWTPLLNSQTTLVGGWASLTAVAYGQDGAGNRLWVAGAGPSVDVINAVLVYSSNGTSWTPIANSQTTIFGGRSTVLAIAFGQDGAGNRLWVAGANGATVSLAYSSNGTSWTPISGSKTTLFGGSSAVYGVAYGQDGAGNRLWVAGGYGDTNLLAYSYNGTTWTPVSNSQTTIFGGNSSVYGVAYGQDSNGNRLWLAGGSGRTNCLAYSSDGTNWTPVANSKTNLFGGDATVRSVAYGQDTSGNRFWFAGSDSAGSAGGTATLAYSTNGITGWTAVPNSKTTLFGGNSVVYSVAFGQDALGNALWVAGGNATTSILAYSNILFLPQGVGANQNPNTIEIGVQAGQTNQATNAIAIGVQAGQTNQRTNAIAIGQLAGAFNQSQNAIAIGQRAGQTNQATNAIAIGQGAGQTNQATNAIAIGQGAGQTNQSQNTIAIGQLAGAFGQDDNAIAIGQGAGQTNQQTNAIAIGQGAGQTNQSQNTIAIGQLAGALNQSESAIAIGNRAGQTNQATNAIAIANSGTAQVVNPAGTWTSNVTPGNGSTQSIYSLAYGKDGSGNKLWIYGSSDSNSNAVLAYSSDGRSGWTAVTNSQTSLFGGFSTVWSVAYGQDSTGNGLWLAGASGTTNCLAYSTDGRTNWTAISGSKTILFGGAAIVRTVAYGQDGAGNRLWVAGSNGTTSVLAYSSDGTTWTPIVNSQTTLFGGSSIVNSVAYGQDGAGNRLWVAGAQGATNCLAYSSDGTTWTPISGSKTNLFGGNDEVRSVAYGKDGAGNRLWIAVSSASFAYSSNGTSWSPVSGSLNNVSSIAYGEDNAGNRLWVATSKGNYAYTYSSYGITGWTTNNLGATIISVGYGQDSFGTPLWLLGGNGPATFNGGNIVYSNSNVAQIFGSLNQSQNAIAIGQGAGQMSQGETAIAIGSNAGQMIQGAAAVAIGQGAGQTLQGTSAVAIGTNAGQLLQPGNAVAIGSGAGQATQGIQTVAIGQQAGQTLQGTSSVAIGFQSGSFSQGLNSLAIGQQAGQTNQGTQSVAIGFQAGQTNQGTNTVAIGILAGTSGQGFAAVAIGFSAGQTNQGANAVAIGQLAGQTNQGTNAVAVGFQSGSTGQGAGAVAIGSNAGFTNQGTNSVAIGANAGQTNLGQFAISIGAGSNVVDSYGIAIGFNAGSTQSAGARSFSLGTNSNGGIGFGAQAGSIRGLTNGIGVGGFYGIGGGYGIGANSGMGNTFSVAIGYNNGFTNAVNAAAIGFQAGQVRQQSGAIAIGFGAGQTNQGTNALAIGFKAGQVAQGSGAIAIGYQTGQFSQGQFAFAIGNQVGQVSQGQFAVAIGQRAGVFQQGTNAVTIASSDGINEPNSIGIWNPPASAIFGGAGIVSSIAYGQDGAGNPLWVAGGGGTGSNAVFAYSSNGTGWTALANSNTTLFGGISNVQSVAYGQDGAGNRLWVAGIYGLGVTGATAVLAYSSNGITGWTAISGSKTALFGGDGLVYSVAYGQDSTGNRLWVAGGYGATAILAYSSNGMTGWTAVANSQTTLFGGTSTYISSVAYGQDSAGNRLWVAGSYSNGGGTTAVLAYSSNGRTGWTAVANSKTTLFGGDANVKSVAYGQDGAGNRLWVAGAYAPAPGGTAILAYSNNGMTGWTAVANSKTTLFGGDPQVWSVAYGQDAFGNRLWVAGSDGTTNVLAYSSNGMTGWTAIPNSKTALFGGDATVVSVAFGQDILGNPIWQGGSNRDTIAYSYFPGGVPLSSAFGQGQSAISIGYHAGQVTQGTAAVAIGFQAGQTNQGQNAVAIGTNAGNFFQGTNAVAIGQNAGFTNQGFGAVAIGFTAGQTLQSTNAIAIGFGAGQTNQGRAAVAIGFQAGFVNQNTNAVAIGLNAGFTNQGQNAVAIGFSAGFLNQGTNAVAVGFGAGQTNQGLGAVALGNSDINSVNQLYNSSSAGGFNQGFYAVAIGSYAGNYLQGSGAIAVGYQAGQTNQLTNAIAIGFQAGQVNQGTNAIAIGYQVGQTNQAANTINIGFQVGQTGQGTNAIAIGQNSGQVSQGASAIAIGQYAGQTNQQTNAIALGQLAGSINQGVSAIAIGQGAGQTNQQTNAIAIGQNAGAFGQQVNAIAIGQGAGQTNQATNAIAIGQSAGQTNQGTNAIAIGQSAGAFGQGSGAIAIGASAGQTNQGTNAIAVGTSFIYNSGIFTPNAWAPVVNSQTTIFGGSSTVYSVAYGQDGAGNRLWVAGALGGTSILAYSSNGQTGWTPVTNSQTTLFGGVNSYVLSLAYGQDGAGNRLWVAGGFGATALLATSSNGTSWTAVANSQTTLFGGSSQVQSVAFGQDSAGNRLWVSGSNGTTAVLAFSSNGTNWTAFANSQTTLFGVSAIVRSVAYGQDGAGNRLWIAGAQAPSGTATLAYSSDGRTNWTLIANSKTNLFGGDAFVRSVAYGQDSGGNRLWVAGAQGATNCLAYSPDGTTWTPVSNSKTNLFGGNAEVFSVAYGQDNAGNRLWVAGAGAITGGITNILAYSSDGRTNWTPVANSQTTIFGGASQALSVAFGQDSTGNPFWVSGSNGTTAVLAYMNMFLTQGVGANQGQNAIAIGQNAGAYTQAVNAIAIGVQAGQTNQGTNAIAMGFGAGALNQGGNAIAIGLAAGQINQLTNAIAIGASAGQTLQGTNAIALGASAGQTNQGLNAIAIGRLAGAFGQGTNAVAIGQGAGQTNQGTNAIALGISAGQTNQTQNAIAIGLFAGAFGQGDSAIAIGFQTGQTNQQTNAIALGAFAGQTNQGINSIAIGQNAGQFNQFVNAVAIGVQAGQTNQQTNAIAIGSQTGQTNQSTNAIAIGQSAGALNQGNNSIAIGFGAGQTNQGANSIVLNASGVAYASTATNALYIRPIRTDVGTTTMSVLMYNQTTKEVLRSTNTTAAGTKTFVIDHPDDAKKYLVHSCLEGPETGVFYRGTGQIVNGGSCVVSLPSYVDSLATHFTINMTPIYDSDTNPKLRCSPVKNNQFTVYGSRNCQFFWSVYGRRGEVEVEPLKSETEVRGQGPYKSIHF